MAEEETDPPKPEEAKLAQTTEKVVEPTESAKTEEPVDSAKHNNDTNENKKADDTGVNKAEDAGVNKSEDTTFTNGTTGSTETSNASTANAPNAVQPSVQKLDTTDTTEKSVSEPVQGLKEQDSETAATKMQENKPLLESISSTPSPSIPATTESKADDDLPLPSNTDSEPKPIANIESGNKEAEEAKDAVNPLDSLNTSTDPEKEHSANVSNGNNNVVQKTSEEESGSSSVATAKDVTPITPKPSTLTEEKDGTPAVKMESSVSARDSEGKSGRSMSSTPMNGNTSERSASNVSASPNVENTVSMATLKRQTHTIVLPSYASWFDLSSIHKIEKESLPEFFNGFNKNKTPEIYRKYRNFMVNTYRLNPNDYLSFTAVRRSLSGDAATLLRVHRFLDRWGVINYQVDPETRTVPIQPPYTGDYEVNYDTPRGIFPFEGYKPPKDLPDLGPIKNILAKSRDSTQPSDVSKASAGLSTVPTASSEHGNHAETSEEPERKKRKIEPANIDWKWSKAGVQKLVEGVKKFKGDWYKISEYVGDKSPEECIIRFLGLPIQDKYLEEHKEKLGPFKYVPGLSFSPRDNPVLTTLAFLCKMVDPEIAAAASSRAIKFMDDKIDEKLASLKPDKVEKKGSEDKKEEVEVDPLVNLKDASTNAFGVLGSRSHLFATYEEREMNKLLVSIVQSQLKMVELKLEKLNSLEKEYDYQRRQLSDRNDELFLEKLSLFKYTDTISSKLSQAISIMDANTGSEKNVAKINQLSGSMDTTNDVVDDSAMNDGINGIKSAMKDDTKDNVENEAERSMKDEVKNEENAEANVNGDTETEKTTTDEKDVSTNQPEGTEKVSETEHASESNLSASSVAADKEKSADAEIPEVNHEETKEKESSDKDQSEKKEEVEKSAVDSTGEALLGESKKDLDGDIKMEEAGEDDEKKVTFTLTLEDYEKVKKLIKEAKDVILKPPRKQLNILEEETPEEIQQENVEEAEAKPISFDSPRLYRYWSG